MCFSLYLQEIYCVCHTYADSNLTQHLTADFEQTGSLTPGLLSKSSGQFSKYKASNQTVKM